MDRPRTRLPVSLLVALLATACSTERPIEPKGGAKPGEVVVDQLPSRQPPPPTRPQKIERQILLLGLDGADWDLIDPLIAADRMPNLKRLITAGSRSPLKTFEPCLSPLIWTTIATGVAPQKHGITDFTARVPDSSEKLLVTSNMRQVEALWNIASQRSYSVGVIGWWASYPAEEIRGFVISDQASSLRLESYHAALGLATTQREHPTTWPPELARELATELAAPARAEPGLLDRFVELSEKRKQELAAETSVDVEDIVSIFRFALLIDQSFVESAIKAIEKRRPELTMLYLNGLDAAEHHFWKYAFPDEFKNVPAADVKRYGKIIDEYYEYTDEVLGRLLALYDEDKLITIIVSDHGHETFRDHDPLHKDRFYRLCSGTHHEAPDGVFVISGQDIRQGAKLRAPTVFDVTPTVLALLDIPLAQDMPGRPITEALDPRFLAAHPPASVPTHSANRRFDSSPIKSPISDELKKKLQGIGYIP